MRNITILNKYFDDIFADLSKYSVGFEPTIRMLDQARTASVINGYPPYDIEHVGESPDSARYRLSMAVAGFTSDDIDISLQDGILSIEGKTKVTENRSYLFKGIAGRGFRRTFCLDPLVKVTDAKLEQGILTIDFVQDLPSVPAPVKIAINDSKKAIEAKPDA